MSIGEGIFLGMITSTLVLVLTIGISNSYRYDRSTKNTEDHNNNSQDNKKNS